MADTEKQTGIVLQLIKGVSEISGELAQLRASVSILKVYVAIQLSPNDPLLGVKTIEKFVEDVVKQDSGEQTRRSLTDVIDILERWKNQGRGPLPQS